MFIPVWAVALIVVAICFTIFAIKMNSGHDPHCIGQGLTILSGIALVILVIIIAIAYWAGKLAAS